jgi:hypothetical protein
MAIIPDDKDWTWVLERPCEECGFDPASVRLDDAASAIRANAHRWGEVLDRATARRRPREDRWSDLEYACHVRDVYRIFDQRLALMLSRDAPVFENWDQDATAIEDRYDLQDPSAVLVELRDAAELYARRCESVEGSQWSRPGTRSNGSAFTVASLTVYGLHDPHHHLWDVGAPL